MADLNQEILLKKSGWGQERRFFGSSSFGIIR
jgi:hypothetical protein